jgi:hypothetical protein
VRGEAVSCAGRPSPPAGERLRLDEDHRSDRGKCAYEHRRRSDAPPLPLVGLRTRRSDGTLGYDRGQELILGVDLKKLLRVASHQAEEAPSAMP